MMGKNHNNIIPFAVIKIHWLSDGISAENINFYVVSCRYDTIWRREKAFRRFNNKLTKHINQLYICKCNGKTLYFLNLQCKVFILHNYLNLCIYSSISHIWENCVPIRYLSKTSSQHNCSNKWENRADISKKMVISLEIIYNAIIIIDFQGASI